MALTKVSGSIIDQPFDVGIITATNFRSGVATVGTMHVTGNLQVDGTTTTLDTIVTEVDRLEVAANNNTVGLAVTQSGTGDIFNLYDGSTEVFSVADGGDVTITDSIIHAGDTNTKLRFPAVDTITAETGGTERLRIKSDGSVGIGTDNPVRKLHVNGTSQFQDYIYGNSITNKIYVNDDLALSATKKLYFDTGSNTYIHEPTGDQLAVVTGGTEKLRITSNGRIGIGTAEPQAMLHVDGTTAANSRIIISRANFLRNNFIGLDGDADELVIAADEGNQGGSSHIKFRVDGTEKLRIDSAGVLNVPAGIGPQIRFENQHSVTTDAAISTFDDANGVLLSLGSNFYFNSSGSETRYNTSEESAGIIINRNGVINFNTGGTGATATTRLGISTDGIVNVPDGGKFTCGTGNDLQIYHDSGTGDSFISESGSGNLKLTTGSFRLRNAADDEHIIWANEDAEVRLYYDNSKKFETTTTGAKVTGALEVTQEYPSIRPTLDLNFAATKTLDRRITFTRDSLGTYTDEMGIVRYASNNVPRFDHDPTTGESLGLLIEESRTNYIDNSNDVSQWNRIINNATVESNTTDTLSPDGTNTSTKITGGTNSGISRDSILSVSTSTTYTASIFAKKGTADSFKLEFGSGANQFQATFNLTTKAFSNTSTGGWFASVSTSYVDYPNGWVRVILTGTTSGSASGSPNFAVYGISSGYVYFWGGQLEVGSFPTSYIPTSGSTVTRAADTAKITGTNFTDFYNNQESTIVCNFTQNAPTSSSASQNERLYSFRKDSGADTRIDYVTYNSFHPYIAADGSAVANLTGFTHLYGGLENKTAVRVKENDFAVAFNGTIESTDSSGTWPPTSNNIIEVFIGSQTTNSSNLNGHIKQFSYYTKALPNAQLQGLTQQ